MVVAPGQRVDLREAILTQIQATLKLIAPGATLPLWDGTKTEPFVSDLGGRVYTRRRPQTKVSDEECPYVEVFSSPETRDKIEPLDGEAYMASMQVIVTGYARAEDAGDGNEAEVRARLHDLGADLRMALEAAQEQPENTERMGCSLVVNHATSDYIVAVEGPYGAVVIEAMVRYPFCARFP